MTHNSSLAYFNYLLYHNTTDSTQEDNKLVVRPINHGDGHLIFPSQGFMVLANNAQGHFVYTLAENWQRSTASEVREIAYEINIGDMPYHCETGEFFIAVSLERMLYGPFFQCGERRFYPSSQTGFIRLVSTQPVGVEVPHRYPFDGIDSLAKEVQGLSFPEVSQYLNTSIPWGNTHSILLSEGCFDRLRTHLLLLNGLTLEDWQTYQMLIYEQTGFDPGQ